MESTSIGAGANVDNADAAEPSVRTGDVQAPAGSGDEGRKAAVAEAAPGASASPKLGAAPEAPAVTPENTFPAPPQVPTQLDASGIRYDFNDGCRVQAPMGPDIWRIRLIDLDTGNFLFQTTRISAAGRCAARKNTMSIPH